MAAKKQQSKRGRSEAARKNQEVDDLDLASQFASLPPPADATLSPLAADRQPDSDEQVPATTSAASAPPQTTGPSTTDSTPASPSEQAEPQPRDAQATRGGRQRSRSTRRSKSPTPDDIEQARRTRDKERDRLVREALEKHGRDPDELTPKPLPMGGKHRPTIELSPDEYAAINIANAIRPDLFDTTLVGFVRACARNWERIAAALEEEHTGSRETPSGIPARQS